MAQPSFSLVSQYLRRLKTRHGDAATDHELLQRFVAHRDESAFAALVERHAPLVLRVCRSILGNHHDAEDIFQAVFLVLARKAGSIRKGESVGSWLYAVASRLAHKERIRAGKRRVSEQQALVPPEQTPMDSVTWSELRDILHAEVNRLPEKLRAAVVLCYWEGRTQEQAGKQLGCARDTIKDRLEKARELLRTRLARRGLVLPAAWFAASLSDGAPTVSAAVVRTTIRGAMLFSMGQGTEGAVSAAAVACAREVLQGMLMNKLKYGLALILMVGVLSGGAGLAMLSKPAMPATPETPATQTRAEATPKQEQEHDDPHGDPLPPGVVARLGTLRFRHGDAITRIAIGADGKSILSVAGKIAYIWDSATGKERRRFPKHEAPVTSIVLSRDGKLLASGCQDGTIHVWDAATGRELRHFTAHKDKKAGQRGPAGPYGIEFTPDGRHIVSSGSDNTIRLWATASGEQIREFGPFSSAVGFSLSPDGKTLLGAVKDDKTWELRLWEVATGRILKRRPQPGKRILSAYFSPDGKTLAVTVGEGDWQKPCDIQLLDGDAWKVMHSMRAPEGWISCRFSPDGKTLVSEGGGNGGRLWDVATAREVGRIGEGFEFFSQLLFCPDGRTLVSFTQNHHGLRFWDRASGKEIPSSGDELSPIDFLSFSQDGRRLAAGSKSYWDFRLWDVDSRKKLHQFQHGCLIALQLAPDGRQLATAAFKDTQARIWDAVSGKELRRITTSNDILSLAWSADGKTLATWSTNAPIRLWNPQTGEQVSTLNANNSEIGALVFSPDGKTLAALGMESRPSGKTLIFLWTVNTGKQLPPIETPIRYVNTGSQSYPRLAFSLDGRTLAAGGPGTEESVYLWEAATGRLRLSLSLGETIDALAFSPDGKLLAAANNLNYSQTLIGVGEKVRTLSPRVHLWDLAANKELPPLQGHQGAITSLSFSPDGKLLATGGNDTTILLWDATRFRTSRPAEVQLQPEQIESLWADLGGADAAKAYRAIRTLAATPKASAAFLNRQLRPVLPVNAKQVARLLADLDSEQFEVREKAMQELEKLGDSVTTELHKALADKPSPEAKRRIEMLLGKEDGKEHLRMIRALETLEGIGTPEARDLCKELASGVAEAPLTREARAALRRMTR